MTEVPQKQNGSNTAAPPKRPPCRKYHRIGAEVQRNTANAVSLPEVQPKCNPCRKYQGSCHGSFTEVSQNHRVTPTESTTKESLKHLKNTTDVSRKYHQSTPPAERITMVLHKYNRSTTEVPAMHHPAESTTDASRTHYGSNKQKRRGNTTITYNHC